MPAYGGFSPQPERYGGGKPRLRLRLEALNAGMGTGYDTSEGSAVDVENMATARVIEDAAEACQRLANQWDPLRMTDFLPRWERIMRLAVSADDTKPARRRRVAAVWERWGQTPTYQQIKDKLQAALGDVLVDLQHSTSIVSYSPLGPIATPPTIAPWYSTAAHLLILVQAPGGMSESDFYAAVSQIDPILDGFMPAWTTWDWIRNGPSGDGFFLDDGHNLTNEAFD